MATPKLRFKEFDGDWNQVKISDYSNTVTSGSRDWAQYYSDKGDKFIRMTNLVRDGIYLDLSDLRFVDLPKDSNEGKRTSLQSGDILISITAELGKLGWINSDLGTAYINQHTALVRMNENVDSKFVAYTLSTEKYNNKLNNLNDSGAKAGLNLGTIRNFELTIPQKKEQTKIASFLSSVDEKISQLNQKHELLSQYKQGMMQKLFSQQIRFKTDDGGEFGEWEKLKFADSFNFYQTNSYSRALLSEVGEIMNIHYGDIHSKFSTLFDVSKEVVPFINGEVDTSKISSEQYLRVGDLVIADASEDYKDIGKTIEVIHLDNSKVVAGLHTYIARPIKQCAMGFNGYLMQTFEVREQIKTLATGISVLGISKTNLGKVELKIPCLEEQTKIANFLSSIDQKIEKVAQQIEQTKQWKKGLLQQMFV
jgi:type I restriction enzyme S subunit